MEPINLLAVERRSLADEVADRLREAILSGSLAPGQRLHEGHIAAALRVSRSPVREALSRLSAEKLLLTPPNHGAVVTQMSMTDVEEVYSLRAAIETLAVQLAVERATSDDLTTMRAIAAHNGGQSRAETAREFAELDVTFHDMIYQAARHAHLFSSWSLLRPHILRILTWRNLVNSDYQYICSVEHEELVECIADHDMHRAQALVRAHLHGAYQRLADAYRSRGGIAVEGEDPVAGGSVSTEPVWNGTNERLANNRAIGRDEGGTELLRSRDREERT